MVDTRERWMLRYYYINKEWIVSRTAQRVYRIAAILSIALFLALFGLRLVGSIPEKIFPLIKLLLFAGVLGAGTTMVAMEYFLFGFDNSSALKKAFWFCVMLFPPLGPAIYCFVVYTHSGVLERTHTDQAGGAVA